MKKKLTPKSIIVAALALILAVSMFGCSKDTTAAEDKTEKTVSTENVETVQDTETQEDKGEAPTVEQPSAKAEAEDTSSEKEPAEAAEDTESDTTETEQASQPVELFSSVNETVYATTTVNIRDTYSVNGNQLGSLSTAQSATRTGIGTGEADGWSRIEFNGQAAYVSSDYLSTVKIETSTPTSKPSTNTNTNTNTSTSQSQSSNSSSDDDWDKYMQNAANQGWDITGESGGKHNCETIDASNDTVADWAGGEVIFGENGTITVIRP